MNAKSLTLTAGDTDPFGNKVRRVLATSQDKKYAIWETADGQIVCDADDGKLKDSPDVTTWTIKVVGLTSRRKEFEDKYSSQVANAYKLCFEGDSTGAVNALKATYEQIVGEIKAERYSRIGYLLGALIVSVLCGLAWLLFTVEGASHPALQLFSSLAAGIAVAVLGGFMSVAIGLNKQNFELEDSFLMNLVYGALRMVVASIAGYVVTLMIRTGVLLSFLKETNAVGGYLLACFLGGFSERLITKSLRQIEEVA